MAGSDNNQGNNHQDKNSGDNNKNNITRMKII